MVNGFVNIPECIAALVPKASLKDNDAYQYITLQIEKNEIDNLISSIGDNKLPCIDAVLPSGEKFVSVGQYGILEGVNSEHNKKVACVFMGAFTTVAIVFSYNYIGDPPPNHDGYDTMLLIHIAPIGMFNIIQDSI